MQYVLLLVAFVNIILSLVVLLNAPKKQHNQFFAPIAFFGAFWSLGTSLMLYQDERQLALLGMHLFFIAPVWTAYSILIFSMVFPHKKRIWRYQQILLVIPPLLLTLFYIHGTRLFISLAVQGDMNQLIASPLGYSLYSLYFFLYLGMAPALMLRSYLSPRTSSLLRSQILHATVAISVTSAVSAVTNLTLPVLGNSSLIWAGPLTGLPFLILISRAILRYRLFDIRLVVARSAAYLASIFILLTAYSAASYLLVSGTLKQQQEAADIVSNIVLVIFTVATFSPLKRFFDKTTNSIFYQDAYDPQAFIDQLNKTIVSTVELKELLSTSAAIIDANIKPSFVGFIIGETRYSENREIGSSAISISPSDFNQLEAVTEQYATKVFVAEDVEEEGGLSIKAIMDKYDVAVLVKLVPDMANGDEGRGYLLIGPKKSGNRFNSQDYRVLSIIANELVIAMQNALRFEEIEKFNETLQKKIEDATSELRRTNEKLRALDEAKDEFISMASHQLRTPLTSIKGYLSMVLEGDVGKINPKQEEMLSAAFISSQRMVYLIADLLNVSRLKTGKFIIESEPVDLVEVVKSELQQLKETAKSRGLTLTFKAPKRFPIVNLDETKTRQVIMNFVDNAIYYTPAGGKIEIALTANKQKIELTVNDTGIGVPKQDQHKLFTKFFRAHNAQRARPDGTGLGLFMAQKVVVAQGGAIVFSSKEHEGSTFGFTFPLEKVGIVKKKHSGGSEKEEKEAVAA